MTLNLKLIEKLPLKLVTFYHVGDRLLQENILVTKNDNKDRQHRYQVVREILGYSTNLHLNVS